MPATILCADNDRSLCQILARALGEAGHRVLTAHDGEQALAVLYEEAPDLALLDLLLPRVDGFGALEQLRAGDSALAQTPVMLLSACAITEEYRQRASALDAMLLAKPVPLKDLLAMVEEHVAKAQPAATPEPESVQEAEPKTEPQAESESGRSHNAELAGSLDELPFPALLHHLHGLRASGVLHLEFGKKRKWIQIRSGHPVAVRSNIVQECLGHYLQRSGRIGAEILDESLRRMKQSQGLLQGEMLVAMHVLSEEELSTVLRDQAEEKLYEIFVWEEGSFRFEFNGRLQRANSLGVERSPANLILHGVRGFSPDDRVSAFLETNAARYVVPSESPFYRFQDIQLDATEKALLRVDGKHTLGQLVGDDEGTGRAIHALTSAGMLDLRDEPLWVPPEPELELDDGPPLELHDVVESGPPELQVQRAELVAMAQSFPDRAPHEILGVEEDASDPEIREAYEWLAKRVHPDGVIGAGGTVERLANDVFSQVTAAFQAVKAERRNRRRSDHDRTQQEAMMQEAVRARLGERQAAAPSDEKRELKTRRVEQECREAAPSGAPDRRKGPRREADQQALEAEELFQEGERAMKSRDFVAANRAFGRATKLQPEEWEYLAYYGYSIHLSKPDDENLAKKARLVLRDAINLAGDHEKPYLFMARICQASGHFDSAQKMFMRAVVIQPSCVEAQRELRLLDMRIRKSKKGILGRLIGS